MNLSEAKADARRRAFAARKAAKGRIDERKALQHLRDLLSSHAGRPLAGYMPIRTEIDPVPVMKEWSGPVGVPVIKAAGQPLWFSRWTPGTDLVEGPFGAKIPARDDPMTPEVLIVPLVAFGEDGARLGYGGGFYDRTLECLRVRGTVLAVGFAFEAQCLSDLPVDPFDQPLEAIVTETGFRRFD